MILSEIAVARLIGNGQAPVHKYWKEILNDYILPGKFDPTLYVDVQLACGSDDSHLCLKVSLLIGFCWKTCLSFMLRLITARQE